MTVDDEIKVEYSFHNTDFSIGFPFGVCEATNRIYVADYAKHCVYHGIASSMDLVSRRMVRQNQAVAREIKTKVPEDALPDLRVSCGQ